MGKHQPHLLIPARPGAGDIVVTDETRRHLEKVLRISESPITYTDGAGLLGSGVYRDGRILHDSEEVAGRLDRLTVAVAPPHSSSRARFIVEKLAELGVARLAWLRTRHSEGRAPRPEKAAGWACSALEQSRGAWLMDIVGPIEISDIATLGTPVFASVSGRPAGEIEPIADPVLCVGPEGGFAPAEIPDGALAVNLGATILRVETAAIVGVAVLRERWRR